MFFFYLYKNAVSFFSHLPFILPDWITLTNFGEHIFTNLLINL
jgi:hypothetical protein